jgi:hypothetical protein
MQRRPSVDFSLSLHTANHGTARRTGVNPFTGAVVEFPIDHGLTAAERAAVRSVLSSYGASDADADGFRYIVLPDETKIGVDAGHVDREGVCPGVVVECNSTSADAAAFVFELASKGNMTVGSSVDPAVVAAVSSEQSERVKSRWPDVPVLRSPEDLLIWVKQGLATHDIA